MGSPVSRIPLSPGKQERLVTLHSTIPDDGTHSEPTPLCPSSETLLLAAAGLELHVSKMHLGCWQGLASPPSPHTLPSVCLSDQ